MPMTSQHMYVISRFLLITSMTMADVKSAMTAKKRLYRGSPIMYREE